MKRCKRAIVALTLLCAHAWAEPPERRVEARERFDRGLRLFDQGDDEGALAEFQRAYSLVPNARVLYNIGLVRAALHQPVEAVAALDELLGAKAGLPEDRLEHARRVRAEQNARIALLTIRVDVANARVEIDGTEVGTTPIAKPVRLASGSHRVTVAADKYHPERREVSLAGGEVKSLAVELRPLTSGQLAELEVKTTVPGATLSIDGRVAATTPLGAPLSLAPGRHSVELRRVGYLPVKRTVLLRDGASQAITLPLALDPASPASGRLELGIREENAVVFVDGVPRSGLALSLPHGRHRLRVERAGFFPFEREVDVARTGPSRVAIELEPTADFRASYRDAAKSRRFWSLVAVGGGAVILGSGVGFLVWNKHQQDEAQDAFDSESPRHEPQKECWEGQTDPQADCRDLVALANNIDTVNGRFGIGWALVAVGAATAGAGTFFWLTGDDPDRYEPRPESDVFGSLRVSPNVSPGVATLGINGQF